MKPLLRIIKKNIILAPYTALKIGGRTKFFLRAKTEKQIMDGVKFAKSENLPFFILGGGTNILISDRLFPGLVIKDENSFVKNMGRGIFGVGSGFSLSKLVKITIRLGYEGIEWGIKIPGTIGGAIFGNSGEFEHSIHEVVERVKVLEEDGRIKTYKNQDCRFGYKDSVFQHKPLVILAARLRLKSQNKNILARRADNYLRHWSTIPPLFSPGYFFRKVDFRELKLKDRKLIPPEKIKSGRVSVVFLIEQSVSRRQVKWLNEWLRRCDGVVRGGHASSEEILKIMDISKKLVFKKFGIVPKELIRYMGFNNL